MMLDVREIQRFITLGKIFTCRSGEVLVEKAENIRETAAEKKD